MPSRVWYFDLRRVPLAICEQTVAIRLSSFPDSLGSSTSRSVSAKSVKPSVVIASARPAHRIGHGELRTNLKPSDRITPQEGVGGRTPSPRKDRPASKVITTGRSIAARISSGARMFGRMWLAGCARSTAPSDRSASTYIWFLADIDLGAGDARIGRNPGDADDEDLVDERRAEQRQDRQGQDDGRESLDRVEDDHDAIVDAAAEVAAEQPKNDAADHGDEHRGHRGDEGDAGAVHDPREQVAAQMVGAEQVILGWPFQDAREVLFGVVVGGEQRAENDEQKEDHHDDKAQRAQRLLEHLAQHGHAIQRAAASGWSGAATNSILTSRLCSAGCGGPGTV